MSNITQIYSIVNDAVADALGAHAPRAKDTTSFVSLGKSLEDAGKLDAFFGALACRIAKTVEFVRLYERNDRRVLRDMHEFGAFVQKVYTELPDAVANPSWAVSNGNNPPTISRSNPYGVTTTVNITCKLFGDVGTWSIEVAKPTKQIKQAFTSETEMVVFIDAINLTVENAYNIQAEAIESLAVATGIALCLEKGKATNVLQVWNNSHESTTLTVSTCAHNPEYLAFESELITKTAKYMRKPSKLFNAAGYTTFTPEDKLVVEVLTTYATAAQFYLRSNTYHEELVRLPGYNEIEYWQGSGESFADADVSTIDIKNIEIADNGDTPATAKEIKQSGIVAYLRDEDAVAAYFGERYTWEDFNKRDRLVTHGEQADISYAVEPHANAWVFYRADAT